MSLEISHLDFVETWRPRGDLFLLDERIIKLLQYDLGVSNTAIARALNVSVATITRHIKNQRHNEFVQKGIARALKTTLPAIAKTGKEKRAA